MKVMLLLALTLVVAAQAAETSSDASGAGDAADTSPGTGTSVTETEKEKKTSSEWRDMMCEDCECLDPVYYDGPANDKMFFKMWTFASDQKKYYSELNLSASADCELGYSDCNSPCNQYANLSNEEKKTLMATKGYTSGLLSGATSYCRDYVSTDNYRGKILEKGCGDYSGSENECVAAGACSSVTSATCTVSATDSTPLADSYAGASKVDPAWTDDTATHIEANCAGHFTAGSASDNTKAACEAKPSQAWDDFKCEWVVGCDKLVGNSGEKCVFAKFESSNKSKCVSRESYPKITTECKSKTKKMCNKKKSCTWTTDLEIAQYHDTKNGVTAPDKSGAGSLTDRAMTGVGIGLLICTLFVGQW